jgi:hypothetical protein
MFWDNGDSNPHLASTSITAQDPLRFILVRHAHLTGHSILHRLTNFGNGSTP